MTTDAIKAYQLIKEKILSLELVPGSVIQDSVLTAELGVGRTPIREALKLLAAEKLVVTVPRRGIFVSHVSITDLQQISEVRLEVEGLSARLAAMRATADEMAALETCCQALEAAASADVQEKIQLDRRLHRAIAAAAHNVFLEAEVERFYSWSLRLWYLTLGRMHAGAIDVARHRELVDAIRHRDAERAESSMRKHVQDFQQSLRTAM
jgi:DNA-binding GntR family transcriptional regulator